MYSKTSSLPWMNLINKHGEIVTGHLCGLVAQGQSAHTVCERSWVQVTEGPCDFSSPVTQVNKKKCLFLWLPCQTISAFI